MDFIFFITFVILRNVPKGGPLLRFFALFAFCDFLHMGICDIEFIFLFSSISQLVFSNSSITILFL